MNEYGEHRRVMKLVNGEIREYYLWYDRIHLAAVLDENKQAQVIYLYHPEESNAPSLMLKNGVVYKLLQDPGLGSIRYAVNLTNNQIEQQVEYDEYGNILNNTNAKFQPLLYAGGLYDFDTKLYRFGARDYDPTIGRWTAKDPIGFAGGDTNLYAYVGGNPMSYNDPSGLKTTLITTYDYGFGSHSALQITNANGTFLYDPSGSYLTGPGGRRGSGDSFSGDDANLATYLAYQRSLGSSVGTIDFNTNLEQEEAIINSALNRGGGGAFGCASSVSNVLGQCGINGTMFPGSLANQAKNKAGVCSNGK